MCKSKFISDYLTYKVDFTESLLIKNNCLYLILQERFALIIFIKLLKTLFSKKNFFETRK